jgi:hypothetical protein
MSIAVVVSRVVTVGACVRGRFGLVSISSTASSEIVFDVIVAPAEVVPLIELMFWKPPPVMATLFD